MLLCTLTYLNGHLPGISPALSSLDWLIGLFNDEKTMIAKHPLEEKNKEMQMPSLSSLDWLIDGRGEGEAGVMESSES